jgi:hypothetical protein
MAKLMTDPVAGRNVWTGPELAQSDDWIWELSGAEIADIDTALNKVLASGRKWSEFGRDDFTLTTFGNRIEQCKHELKDGRGFVVLRGLPVNRYSIDELKAIYWGIGCHLGNIITQNARGSVMEHITDMKPANTSDPNLRSYITAQGQPPHCDVSDIVGLLCVNRAKEGGRSVIVNTMAIYNRILAEHPEFMAPLVEGFYHDLRGEGRTGDNNETSDVPVPVFSRHRERLRCWFHKKLLMGGSQKRGVALTELQRNAIETIEQLGSDPEMRLDMDLVPGDIQFLNNYSTMHYRTAFVDDETHKRLMLRLWINLTDDDDIDPILERWVRRGIPAQSWVQGRPIPALGNLL